MNTQTYEQIEEDSNEIDIKELLKKILLQWRAAVIFSLVIALLVGCFKYIQDSTQYRTDTKAYALKSSEIIKKSKLKVSEVDAVRQAVEQKQQIDDMSDYMDDSLYLNLDPTGYKQLSMLYYIRADKGADAADIQAVYSEMLNTDDSISRIREASGLKAKAQYFRELISVTDAKASGQGSITTDSSTDVMKVTFALPEKADEDAVSSTIDSLITGYDISDLGISGGTVKRISSTTNIITSNDISATKRNYINDIANLKSSYQSSISSFSDDQITLLSVMLREEGLYDEETTDRIKESSKGFDKEVAPSFSAKYCAIGFIAGLLVYACFVIVIELLKKRCSSVVNPDGSMSLGSLLDLSDRKGGLLCDRHLMKTLYRRESDLDDGIDRILTRSLMNSSKEKLSEMELWTVGFDSRNVPVIEKIISAGREAGIDITVRATENGRPDSMIKEIAEKKSVALVTSDGTSLKQDVSFLMEMLVTRGADYLGVVELL